MHLHLKHQYTQKNITEIYQERSYDELTTALNEYLNGGSEEEESSERRK